MPRKPGVVFADSNEVGDFPFLVEKTFSLEGSAFLGFWNENLVFESDFDTYLTIVDPSGDVLRQFYLHEKKHFADIVAYGER